MVIHAAVEAVVNGAWRGGGIAANSTLVSRKRFLTPVFAIHLFAVPGALRRSGGEMQLERPVFWRACMLGAAERTDPLEQQKTLSYREGFQLFEQLAFDLSCCHTFIVAPDGQIVNLP